MPHGDLETRVLDLAVRQGLVTPEDLRGLDEAALGQSSRWGPRLAVLEQKGLLRATVLDELAWQILAGGEGTTDGRPTTPLQGVRPESGHPAPWEELPDRYADVEPLGAGGMGRVVRAYDRLLRRPVALKFLRPRESEREQRVLAEARAQAQVDHPNVCKVFDVGEAAGEPYIAMQLIQGEALHHAWRDLELRERLELMRDVAEGVHASHRAGLLHLDLKPDNVLVELREGGRRHPYVMDFGLGRGEEASEGLAPLGTPPFTSPEQARGDARHLDRRTDVYALGVMLFEAVADASPFEVANYADLMEAILAGRSVPLAARRRDVPRDLALIVAKAMALDPAQRYATALALADDLQRFLDGEPVSVRPATILYRASVWTRRHPRIAGAAGILALAALGAGALAWRTSERAEAQARAAATYGEAMARVQALVRMAHLQPAHDIRPELAVVRDLLANLRRDMPGPGRPGRGSALHALGRGELTLGRPKEALALFQSARQEGLASQALDLDQGQAEAALYLQDVVGARLIRDPAKRKARLEELDRTLKNPALDRLRRSRAASEVQAHYIEAIIAACEDRFPDAVKACDAALEHAPWFYEALVLQAWVASAKSRHQLQGLERGSPEGVRALEASAIPLRKLLEAAPSYPTAYRMEAGRLYDTSIFLENVDTPGAIRLLEAGVRKVREGLKVDPDDPTLLVQEARLRWVQAENVSKTGGDPSALFREARAAAQRAEAVDPGMAMASKVRADVLGALAMWKGTRGEPALAELQEALAALGNYDRLAGQDVVSLRTRGWLLQVESLELIAAGQDPGPALEAGIATYRQLLEKLPQDPLPLANLPRLLGLRFEVDAERGDPAVLDEGMKMARAMAEGNIHASDGLCNGCYLARLRGRAAASRGEAAEPWLRQSRELGERARDIAPSDAAPWLELGAAYTASAGVEPDPARRRDWFAKAEAAFRKASALNPTSHEGPLGLAEVALARLEAGEAGAFRGGLLQADRALALNPRSHEARALRGALCLRAGRVVEGRGDLAAALKANPWLTPRYKGLASG
jgi:serine/threonine-protein kinase